MPASVLHDAHAEALPLKKAKYDALCALSRFCSSEAALYFKNLPCVNTVNVATDSSESSGGSGDDENNE